MRRVRRRWRNSLVVIFARDGDHIHIVPAAQQQEHADNSQCWCTPRLEYVAPNGGRIYLHRRANDEAYPPGSRDAAAAELTA